MIVLRLDVLHGDRPPQRISDLYHDVIALPLELAACLYGDLLDLDLIKIREERQWGARFLPLTPKSKPRPAPQVKSPASITLERVCQDITIFVFSYISKWTRSALQQIRWSLTSRVETKIKLTFCVPSFRLSSWVFLTISCRIRPLFFCGGH